MEVDGRSLLLGMGLFGMVIGACLGIVAGSMDRECQAMQAPSGAGGIPLCEQTSELRTAAFSLVALSAGAALFPLAHSWVAARRAA